MNLERMDLRKARCLVLKESDDSIRNLHVSTGPTLVIDCPPYTMYFVMSSARETKVCLSQLHVILTLLNNNIFLYFFLSLSLAVFTCFAVFLLSFRINPLSFLSNPPSFLPNPPSCRLLSICSRAVDLAAYHPRGGTQQRTVIKGATNHQGRRPCFR